MRCGFLTHTIYSIIVASLVFTGGALCFSTQVYAQGKAARKSVVIQNKDDYRYISSTGMPYYAVANGGSSRIVEQDYVFRIPVKPTPNKRGTLWTPAMFFGVALDGVPIEHALAPFAEADSVPLNQQLDQHGGVLEADGRYIYGAPPVDLIKKNFSHIGYAADGFPIFVSKDKAFKSSYVLKEGLRPNGSAGQGMKYNGTYLTDYTYIKGAGLLDACGGLKLKSGHYIYVLTKAAPHVPLCWAGVPDESFKKPVREIIQEEVVVAPVSRVKASSPAQMSNQKKYEMLKARRIKMHGK